MNTEDSNVGAARPGLIRKSEVSPLLWGDEQAGFANDLFYRLTPELAIVVACVAPGGRFTSSDTFRTVFDSDEALFILEGQYTIQNPETGEVRVADEGELILLRGPQWHYGYNFSDRELRIFEAIAPVDLNNSTADMVRPEVAKGFDPSALEDFPRTRDSGACNMDVVARDQSVAVLYGEQNPVRLDVFASNDRVSLALIELAPGQRTDSIRLPFEAAVFVTSGCLHVRVPDGGVWTEVTVDELFALPPNTEWQLFNGKADRCSVVLAVAGNIATGFTAAP
ncbi:MAG: cupin domain-containing protein [Hyphomonadaceae bacterium]|nr:cupin domain-containing protein [Hyphomonadaceae bacterium]